MKALVGTFSVIVQRHRLIGYSTSADTAVLITGECVASPRSGVWTICPGWRTVNCQSMLHFALHIQQQQQRSNIKYSNWGNNFYWPSQTDLWKLTVPTTTVWAMDWICICCMHFYQYTHCTHIPILILPHWRSMLFWIRLYVSALFLTSYTVLDREQNYSKCHVFDTSGKLTRDFLRWSGFASLLTSIISIS